MIGSILSRAAAILAAVCLILTPVSDSRARTDTAEILHGNVVVNLVFLKTPAGLNWDQVGQDDVIARLSNVYTWLLNHQVVGAEANLYLINHGQVTIGENPSTTGLGVVPGWMNTAAQSLGFSNLADLNNTTMDAQGADRAFTIFVINYLGLGWATKPATTFTSSVVPAFTLHYYEFCLPVWPLFCQPFAPRAYTHEMLHVFGAWDEYAQATNCSQIPDCNSIPSAYGNWKYDVYEKCAPCDTEPSVMKATSDNITTNTKGLIGWGDHDGDGILDPLDFCPHTDAQAGAQCTGCPVIDCGHECDVPICDNRIRHHGCFDPSVEFTHDYDPTWDNPIQCEALRGKLMNGELCQDSGLCAVYYLDADDDGFGDPAVSERAPAQPPGYVSDNTDCDDQDPAVNPAATELCNLTDDNCDGQVDNDADASCDDGIDCTVDACDGAGACTHTTSDSACDDADLCTEDICDDQAGCVYQPVTCDDGDGCTVDTCDPATGCHYDTPLDCDDGDACTADTCDPDTGCHNDSVSCEDDDACTADNCDSASGCANTPIGCDDANACTQDSCDPASGCANTPIDCDDTDACTLDSCDPAAGCTHQPVDCDDSDACTQDSCDMADGCAHEAIDCDDSDDCTVDTCDSSEGCLHEDTCTDEEPGDSSGCSCGSQGTPAGLLWLLASGAVVLARRRTKIRDTGTDPA